MDLKLRYIKDFFKGIAINQYYKFLYNQKCKELLDTEIRYRKIIDDKNTTINNLTYGLTKLKK
jgi:hypothetical protein